MNSPASPSGHQASPDTCDPALIKEVIARLGTHSRGRSGHQALDAIATDVLDEHAFSAGDTHTPTPGEVDALVAAVLARTTDGAARPYESHLRAHDAQIRLMIRARNQIDPAAGSVEAVEWVRLHGLIREAGTRRRALAASTRALTAVDADIAQAKDTIGAGLAELRRFDRRTWWLTGLGLVVFLGVIAAIVQTRGDLRVVIPAAIALGGGTIGIGVARINRREELAETHTAALLREAQARTRSTRMWHQINNGVAVTDDANDSVPTMSLRPP